MNNLIAMFMIVAINFGCSESSRFSGGGAIKRSNPITSESNSRFPDDDGKTVTPSAEVSTPIQPIVVSPSVVKHEAVFAVRNMNCAFCHARIESNVISNFALPISGSPQSNLQLLSAVYIGFEIGLDHALGRVRHEAVDLQKFSVGSSGDVAKLIDTDARLAGVDKIPGSGNVNYNRLAATAPVVYSRSSGSFTGVIIAEQFIGRIGSLSFKFDPVFAAQEENQVIFYPEIKSSITTVK
jgi:hypothetical protein